MEKRFMCIWFRYLLTDWLTVEKPELKNIPVVLAASERNRMIITAANPVAEAEGIFAGMAAADAKACSVNLVVADHVPGKTETLLQQFALWCIRYSPIVAIDLPNGLILDISGCAHLWGGEQPYLKEIVGKLREAGYHVRAAIADTIGAAWAVARFGTETPVIAPDLHRGALLNLPAAALRLEPLIYEKLQKLGFYQVKSFIDMPRSVLRRRFGENLLIRIEQALGLKTEFINPMIPPVPYQERLPCLEPIKTVKGIEIAIRQLLEATCNRLAAEGKGMRKAVLKSYRVDGKVSQTGISTNRANNNPGHLFKLFQLQISKIEPALGIELFLLEVLVVEDREQVQEALWAPNPGLTDTLLAELLDRLGGKIGVNAVRRYLPLEHHWPEYSIKPTAALTEQPITAWRVDRPRPVRLLSVPEHIDVMALLPDYPPKMFIYKGKRHIVQKADGPERIEREWWHDKGEYRDYYAVENTDGQRYWLFRLGHYDEGLQWFLHGFFA